jgi:glucokinase
MKQITIGIDIGGTNSVIGVVDKQGIVISHDSVLTANYKTAELFVEECVKVISNLLKTIPEKSELIGIGIGAPNGNYYKGTIEFAPNLKWKGIIEFVNLFKSHFDVPTFLTNDANAAALGELIYGGAKEMKDFIVITLGTGLGSGFVVNGNLVYGHDGFAGELGHTIVFPDTGRQCGCGRKGCLETYCSATGIVRTVIELLEESDEDSELRAYKKEKITSKLIAEAAQRGDVLANSAFDYTAKILGMKLADTVAITSPEAIFLFGGLAQSGDLILKPTKNYMEKYMLPIFKNKVKLLHSSLEGASAAILGASALVWSEVKI